MIQDAQGLAVTTDSPQAVEVINQFIDQALTYGCEAEATILKAIDVDEDCAIAQAYAAAYYLSQENWAGQVRAKPYLKKALAGVARVSRREQLYIQGIHAWGQGQIERAISYHVALVQEFPQDLLAVQQAQYHYFYQGDSQGLLNVALAAQPMLCQTPLHGSLLAFGLEQCHQFSQAEALGRRATELRRHNPWAHHAVAHVLDAQGRHPEAVAWMTTYADTWGDCNSMLFTHNWWHVALAYLALGETATVLRLYDSHVWGRARKHTPNADSKRPGGGDLAAAAARPGWGRGRVALAIAGPPPPAPSGRTGPPLPRFALRLRPGPRRKPQCCPHHD